MGRSLRRAKKTRAKVQVGIKRKKFVKGVKPNELRTQQVDLATKLGKELEWNEKVTAPDNYEKQGLLYDTNAGFGRNSKADAVGARGDELADAGVEPESDEELAVACGKMRPSGKAAAQRLTTHQLQIMERLILAHGDDIEAMVKDRKLNSMLHTAAKLRKMMDSYQTRGSTGRCGFRVPNKRLW